ncbi:MAG TPA: hypothetical protein VFK02_12635 [Kofleriaceae bacterium]|nr:hypothetical protein [Kofleriaceae bacterium]
MRLRRASGLAVVTALVAAVIATLGFAACGLQPDVGPLLAGTCENTDTNPAVTVSFAREIRPLLSRPMAGCGCHMPTASGVGPGTAISGLDLSSLASLRVGGHNSSGQIVVAMAPCDSILYQKVEDAPPFGSRMPLGGPPYLTPEEELLLHDWIAEGALDN